MRVAVPDYDSWNFEGGTVLAHQSVAAAVHAALSGSPTLYAWARNQPDRAVFHGRGEAYGVRLGERRVVVRHARRGGALAGLLGDRFIGAPRFLAELDVAARLAGAGVATPRVLVGVVYPTFLVHRADVATERVSGIDLFTLFFGEAPPEGSDRSRILRAVGALVRRLHEAGFVHPDLQLRNVLVESNPSVGPSVRPSAWLLDVDTCRAIAPRDGERRRANLARFERSWDKWNALKGRRLTDQDRGDFMSGYREPAP